jgi:hypothetical protein
VIIIVTFRLYIVFGMGPEVLIACLRATKRYIGNRMDTVNLRGIWTYLVKPPPRWKYDPIRQDRTIRIFLLHRWYPFLGLRGSIIEANLDQAPKYEAISYHWGTAAEKKVIYVDGKTLEISLATYNALDSLRSLWRPRILWIDYICINQADTQEKGKQVALMKDIYSLACRVVVYLGDSIDAPLSHSLMHELLLLREKNQLSSHEIYARYERKRFSYRWPAFIKFLNCQWFERAWIVQEVAVASEIVLKYGGFTYRWEALESLVELLLEPEISALIQMTQDGRAAVRHLINLSTLERLRHKAKLADAYRRSHPLQWAMRRVAEFSGSLPATMQRYPDLRPPTSLGELLEDCTKFRSSDPRDKVYSLLGLATSKAGGPPMFLPDYEASTTPQSVFIETTRFILSTDWPLDFLPHAGMSSAQRMPGLPSWVPDYAHPWPGLQLASISFTGQTAYRAGGTTRPIVEKQVKNHQLTLGGFIVDEILALSLLWTLVADDNFSVDKNNNFFHVGDVLSMLEWHNSALKVAEEYVKDPYPWLGGQSRTEAFWRTLIGDNTTTHRPAPMVLGEDYKNAIDFQNEALPYCLDGGKTMNLPIDEEFWQRAQASSVWGAAIARCSVHRRVCASERGFLGCVPELSRPGDKIAILYGVATPYVIRKAKAEGLGIVYEIVGPCYVHGMMDGEMLEEGQSTCNLTFV